MPSTDYFYITSNALTDKINYSYSQFQGIQFIETYKTTRRHYLAQIRTGKHFVISSLKTSSDKSAKSNTETEDILDSWIDNLIDDKTDFNQINLLLKRFEVVRKIFENYDENFRPIDKNKYHQNINYLKFGIVLILCYEKTSKLQYLNSLLKLNDILCSIFNKIEDSHQDYFRWILIKELEFTEELLLKLVNTSQ